MGRRIMANGTPSPAVTGKAAVAVIALVAMAILIVSVIAIRSFKDAGDVASVMAATVGPLAGLGAAAFGVQLHASAKAETSNIKGKAESIADLVADLRSGASGVQDDAESRAKALVVPPDQLLAVEQQLRRLST